MKIPIWIICTGIIFFLIWRMYVSLLQRDDFIVIEIKNYSTFQIKSLKIKCFQSEIQIPDFNLIRQKRVILQNYSNQLQDLHVQVELSSGIVLEANPVPIHDGESCRVDVYPQKVSITKTRGTLE